MSGFVTTTDVQNGPDRFRTIDGRKIGQLLPKQIFVHQSRDVVTVHEERIIYCATEKLVRSPLDSNQ